MYHKSSYAFFDDADEASHRKEHHFIQDIIAAFHNNEFIVYYQPKVHIPTRRCYGLEALIRWKRGNEIIGPDTFISLFEKRIRYVCIKTGLHANQYMDRCRY